MKKLLLLLLVFTGMVSTASATADYSVQFNQDNNWYKLCDLTDDDNDGIYSATTVPLKWTNRSLK